MSTASHQINGYRRSKWSDGDDSNCSCSKKHYVQNLLGQEEEEINIVSTNNNQSTEKTRHSSGRAIEIGAVCIAEINGRFFLLVEIEIEVGGEEIEQVIIFRLTDEQAEDLLEANVRRCRIVNTIPTSTAGVEVNLICVFVVGDFAFLVFDVENSTDELVLVKVPLCTII